MGGLFGVVGKADCVTDLFYGTDFHSHLGTRRGGLMVRNAGGFVRYIHDISNSQFRSKFEDDIGKMHGTTGIGVISDYEDQPLIIRSHLGAYGIVTVGKVANLEALAQAAFRARTTHFSEMSGGEINQTELIATLINREESFVAGIQRVQEDVDGSCSLLLLTDHGVYAARDKLGRTPVVVGSKRDAYAATLETSALPNLGFEVAKYLGPGEIVLMTPDGVSRMVAPGKRMQICAFLWVYYGYPSSSYEGINVEAVRNRCGTALAANDDVDIDLVAGIPDSGTAHAIGYANATGVPYKRPFVKYTPTWPRSFMPQDQTARELVAKMKLIPIEELIQGMRMLFCEDSIVRGTQLKDTIRRLYACGACEVHMRPACPPLIYGCRYLNFSRSKSERELIARRAVEDLEGDANTCLEQYVDPSTDKHWLMVERIRQHLNVTSLKYQAMEDLVQAIGLPKEKLCTYCWDGMVTD